MTQDDIDNPLTPPPTVALDELQAWPPPAVVPTRADRAVMTSETARQIAFHDLTPEEKDLIAHVRRMGEGMRDSIRQVESLPGYDPNREEWINEAKRHYRLGNMCLVRAITKPLFF